MTGEQQINQPRFRRAAMAPPGFIQRRDVVGQRPAADVGQVSRLVRWSFYALIFLQPLDIPDRTIPIGLPTLAAFIFLPFMFTQARICFRRTPGAIWWFASFFVAFLVWSAFSFHQVEPGYKMPMLFIQEFLLLWVSINLMQYEGIARGSLIALAAACMLVAYFQFKGIFITPYWDHRYGTRYSVMGQDPNYLSGILSLGTVALIGIATSRKDTRWWFRIAAGLGAGFVMIAILRTGSRGGTIAVAAGILALMPGGKGVWARVKNAVVIVLAVAFLWQGIMRTPIIRARYMRTIDEGAMSGREEITPAAWAMVREKPILGWGPVDNTYELGKRAVYITALHPEGDRDTHDVFLDVLTAMGWLGGSPFLIFIFLSLFAGWKNRSGTQGALPLALVAVSIVTGSSINTLVVKIYYFAFGFALANTSLSKTRNSRGAPELNPWSHARLRRASSVTSAETGPTSPQSDDLAISNA